MSRHPNRFVALAVLTGTVLTGTVLIGAVLMCCTANSASAADSAIAEPALQTYATTDGTNYFALNLAPNVSLPAAGPRDVVVLFDTSASQAGLIRERGLAALATLLGGLQEGDRVQVLAVDLTAVPLTKGFVQAKTALQQAAAAIGKRTPLGATDMPGVLRAAEAKFDSASNAPRTIVYIGDGVSAASHLGLEQYRALLDELVDAKISISSYGVGARVDSQLLACLANQTGGMLAIDDDRMDPKQAGEFLTRAVRGTVLWPSKATWPQAFAAVFPKRMPPLRSDRDTVVLGKAAAGLTGDVQVELTAEVAGKSQSFQWTVAAGASNPDYSFLPVLVEAAQVDEGSRLITLGTPGLNEARRIVNEGTHLLSQLARQALVSGDPTAAGRLADEALKRDPQDESAQAVKKQLAKNAKGGTVAVKANETKTSERIEVKQFTNEQAEPPTPEPPAPALPAPADGFVAPADALEEEPAPYDPINEGEGRLLENIEQHNRLMTDLIRTEVEDALRAARSLMESDPTSVEDDLKLLLGRVVRTPELKAETRAQLREQLEAALRESARRASTHDILRQQHEAARAAALDRLRIANALVRKEEKIKQLMDRFNSLMEEGRYLAADEIGEMEVARLDPELPIGQQAGLVAHMTGAHVADVALRLARQKAVVDTLGTVEVALMPFPDDQPVVYPPADWFQELTDRRKRYTSTDLKKVSPAEKKIRDALESPTRMEFTEMPLIDAVAYLKDYHDIEIQLDTRALEDAGVGSDTPVTRNVNGISLKSALRLMLGEYDLTYIIKDEVLLITTQDKADTELVTKAYPVADLVIPVRSMGGGMGGMGGGMMGGGMMGGGMGGMGGGMGGGMMGGMGGGMGGMGGGMGGGMFAVADDLKLGPKSKTPAAAPAKPQAQAKPQAATPAKQQAGAGTKPQATAKKAAPKAAGKPQAIVLNIAKGVDPETAWSDYFAKNRELPEGAIRETVRQLMHAKKYAETVGLINAALRSGNPQPWMYEAVALAMQAGGSSKEDIERALMSGVDFGESSEELLYVAQYMARCGLEERALDLFHQVALAEPLRPQPYLYGLQLAQRLNNLDGIRWSSLGILKQAWPKDKTAIVTEAKRAATAAVAQLKSENRADEASRFQADLDKASIRDCIVKISWTGDADVDVMVEEPSGSICEFRNPRTSGGGVLLGDTSSQGVQGTSGITTETYECPEAFAGSYRVLIRRVWGKITAGKVTVDLYAHFGTPEEKHLHEQIALDDKDALVVFDLPKGRRQEPLAEHQLANAAQKQLAINHAIVTQQINETAPSPAGANGSFGVSRSGLFGALNQAVGYQPVITVLPSGASLSVSGVVSADRRYVRVTPMPFFSGVSSVTTFNLISGTGSTTPNTAGGSSGSSGLTGS